MVGDEELVEGIEKGTKVRVKTPVTVYHSPKLGDFNLEGKEGEVMDVVSLYKGKQTSANLPYKVTFLIPQEGAKDIKLVAHLSAPEIEVVQ